MSQQPTPSSTFPLIDLHQDLSMHLQYAREIGQNRQTDWQLLADQSAKVVVASAFPYPRDDNYFDPITNDQIEHDFRLYNDPAQTPAPWQVIRDRAGLRQVLADPAARGLILHIEGLNLAGDDLWDRLERWYGLGWRSLGPVWILTNPFGGGTRDPSQGLTPLGRELLEWAAQRGVILDFAHMNAPTFWDAAKDYSQPILITHTSAQAIVPGPRSVDDQQLRRVADSGGVAGVFFAGKFLAANGQATVGDITKHIQHFIRVMGIEHVALGTDMGGVTTGLVRGMESLESLPSLWQALRQAGLSEREIEAVAWRNAARVLRELLP